MNQAFQVLHGKSLAIALTVPLRCRMLRKEEWEENIYFHHSMTNINLNQGLSHSTKNTNAAGFFNLEILNPTLDLGGGVVAFLKILNNNFAENLNKTFHKLKENPEKTILKNHFKMRVFRILL